MEKRDDKNILEGSVELDEGYFEVTALSTVRLKRGRDIQSKTNVAVKVVSTPLEDIETGENLLDSGMLK